MMMTVRELAEITKEITEMGYIIPTFEKPTPSFYRLEDGVILAVLIRLNHLVIDDHNPAQPKVNATTECFTFTSNREHMPSQPDEIRSPSIVQENVPFEVMLEKFNPYRLSNGMVVNVKTVLGQVNKMDGYDLDGAPAYAVAAQPAFNVIKPKSRR